MKKILCLLLGISSPTFALEQNPIAPPSVEIVDKFGVNMQSAQLARSLNTVSIGGDLGLSHHVQLYNDLFADGGSFGYIDAFAGTVTRTNISQNSIQIMSSAAGNSLFFRDSGQFDPVSTNMVFVMRAYGPAGSQDFLVYQNNVLNRDASASTGLTFKAVGDARHTLTQSADQSYFTWTTPDGTESKYASYGNRLVEVTYPNGYKVRVSYHGVATNTGFMLKYQLNNQGLTGTPDQITAINRVNQYCSPDVTTTCPTTGWPTATFTWPVDTPSVFWTSGYSSSRYLVKLVTPAGVTEIQYQPDDLCFTTNNHQDYYCHTHSSGLGHWSPRLHSIKTPESTTPNYQYTFSNNGALLNGIWTLYSRLGRIGSAVRNGTDSEGYGVTPPNTMDTTTTNSSEIMVTSQVHDLNVIKSAWTKKGGFYEYLPDARHLVEFYTPTKGRGPKQHYYYNGPRGNLNKIAAVDANGSETVLQEVLEFVDSSSTVCPLPKTCNKPKKVRDALNNITEYEYDSLGRFGNPIKITAPPAKSTITLKASTIYKYAPFYAFYKKDSETITQDPDPVWLLSSEHTCISSAINDTGCEGGEVDTVRTNYYYGPQSSGVANNLLLRGKSVTADGTPSVRVTCYEYDKTGKLMGETKPKGNSTDVQSCQ